MNSHGALLLSFVPPLVFPLVFLKSLFPLDDIRYLNFIYYFTRAFSPLTLFTVVSSVQSNIPTAIFKGASSTRFSGQHFLEHSSVLTFLTLRWLLTVLRKVRKPRLFNEQETHLAVWLCICALWNLILISTI
jgi:hypothetical protein